MVAKQKSSDGLSAGLLGAYAFMVWCVLGTVTLPFPLSELDQHRIAAALGVPWGLAADSWTASVLDPWMAALFPKDPYPLLLLLRRLFCTLALMGLVVWAWRGLGWVRGIWVAVLSLSLPPLQLMAGTLTPHPFCLASLIWAHLLLHSRPWTKTGMAEAFGGGILLGTAAFAAPWGWLFCLAIPVRTLCSKTYRAKLEAGCWWGLILGLLPGLNWWWSGGMTPRDLGIHLETLHPDKLARLFDLVRVGWGWPVILLAALGLRSILRPALLGTQDLIWPLGVALLFGYTDVWSSSLGIPGVVLLVVAGLDCLGQVFISRTEKLLLPTLLVLLLGYYTFFEGHQQVRERQAYSRQLAELSDLVAERVPPHSAVLLGRHNSILHYLNALDPERGYLPLDVQTFNLHLQTLRPFLASQGVRPTSLWMDPERVSMEAEGDSLVGELRNTYRCERVMGEGNSELIRVNLTVPR